MKKVIFLLLIIGFLGVSSMAFAAITLPNPLCPGGAGSSGCVGDLPALIQNIVNYVSLVVGSLAILVFVWAGILFVSSGGNPGQITKARQALMYAVIGTAIALAGTGLVAVVREVVTGQ
ncbi:MAG: hypothetical protein Q7S10_01640 [bacterium]|nr:hypothetical protein [bacterium]